MQKFVSAIATTTRSSRGASALSSSTPTVSPSTTHPSRGKAADSIRKIRASPHWVELKAATAQASRTISEEERNTQLSATHADLEKLSLSFRLCNEYGKLNQAHQSSIRGLTEDLKSVCKSMLGWSHTFGDEDALAGRVDEARKSAQSIEAAAPTIVGTLASAWGTVTRLSRIPQPEMYVAPETETSFAGDFGGSVE